MTDRSSNASACWSRTKRIAAMVILAASSSCAGLAGGPEQAASPKAPAPATSPVDPATMSCDALKEGAVSCDVNRDCEKMCDSGDGRACEAIGRHLVKDAGAAAEWRNHCRANGGSSPWCSTPDADKAAQRFLVRACDLGSGLGCFGLASLYLAKPEARRTPDDLAAATKRAKTILTKSCECGNKQGCAALAKMFVIGAEMMMSHRPPKEFDAAVMLVEACKLGDLDACHDGLRIVTSGARRFDPRLAKDLAEYACKNGDQDACLTTVCAQAARMTLEQNGKEATPDALAQAMVACTVAMKRADPATARGVMDCFASKRSLDCLEPISKVAQHRPASSSESPSATSPSQGPASSFQKCRGAKEFACLHATTETVTCVRTQAECDQYVESGAYPLCKVDADCPPAGPGFRGGSCGAPLMPDLAQMKGVRPASRICQYPMGGHPQ